MDISKIDLTNNNQKLLAGFLLALVVGILWFLLPPLIWFMTNLLYAGGLLIVLGFLAFNRNNIWNYMKQVSWNITKSMIAKDKPTYLYKYYDYILGNNEELKASLLKVKGAENKTITRVDTLVKTINSDKQKAVEFEKKGASKTVLSSLKNKINVDTNQYNLLMPRLENIRKQSTYLQELYELRSADAIDLKYSIDAKVEEYEMLKDMNSATDSASKFLKEDTMEFKMYKESLKQIEDTSSQYIANIQLFETQARPLIENMSMERAVSEDAGAKLIEDFKKDRISLKIEG